MVNSNGTLNLTECGSCGLLVWGNLVKWMMMTISCTCLALAAWGTLYFYGSATNYLGLGYVLVGWLLSTQMSKHAISRLSRPWLITEQLHSHCRCIDHVYTQMGAHNSQKLRRKIGMCVDIAEGSYTNFNTSKYVEEVIEVDELNEGNLSAAAGEDK